MPDIAMCKGLLKGGKVKCPLRKKCVRHTSKPDEYWQSYFIEAPAAYALDGKFRCVQFVKV